MNVNQRLIDELFLRKQVKINDKLYQDLFDTIWPGKDGFIEFLRAEQTDMQIMYAKLIAERISFGIQLSFPVSLFQSLIKIEEEGNDNPNNGYVGQDHVVHTVYLYIVGIYLYFNMKIFHDHINRYFFNDKYVDGKRMDTLAQTVLCFIKSWQMFSFYHDLGYAIERSIDKDGIPMNPDGEASKEYQPYKQFKEEISVDFCAKVIAKCAVYSYIVKRSCIPWREIPHKFMIENAAWVNAENETVSTELLEELKGIENYVQLHAIHSVEDMLGILAFLDRNRIVAVAQNSKDRIVAIVANAKLYYSSNRTCRSKGDYWEILSNDLQNWTFYVPQDELVSISDRLQECEMGEYSIFFEKVYEIIKDDLRHAIVRGGNKITQEAEFVAWKRIREIYREQCLGEYRSQDKNRKFCDFVYDQLTKQFSTRLRECTDMCAKNSMDIIQNVKENLDREIQIVLQNFYEENKKNAFDEATNKLKQSKGGSSPLEIMMGNWADIVKNCLKDLTLSITWNACGLLNCCPQVGLNLKGEQADLAERISQRTEALGIKLTELIDYRSPYGVQDHGIVSTCIAIDIYRIYDLLSKEIPEFEIAKYAFPITQDGKYKYCSEKELYIDVIFSIWLHNVWVKSENASTGIKYKQRIDINPFSYFAAFCDNCQMWNRRQLVNQGYYERNDEGCAANQFDILIEEPNMLRIICETTDIKALLTKRIKSLNDYLENASDLIKVTSIER